MISDDVSENSDKIHVVADNITSQNDKIHRVADHVANISDHIIHNTEKIHRVAGHVANISDHVANISDHVDHNYVKIHLIADHVDNVKVSGVLYSNFFTFLKLGNQNIYVPHFLQLSISLYCIKNKSMWPIILITSIIILLKYIFLLIMWIMLQDALLSIGTIPAAHRPILVQLVKEIATVTLTAMEI